MRTGYSLMLLLCACGAAPPSVGETDFESSLDQAQALLDAGDTAGASQVLARLDPDDLSGTTPQRYEFLLATALHLSGNSWDAYREIEGFTSRYFLSDYEGQIADLSFQIGSHLIRSDRSWWIFGSDQDDGEVVLTQFIGRFPTNPNVPEALMLLGESAFADRDFEMAQERYKDLSANHPRSEWAALASFRLAISSFKLLIGPEYDQTQMIQARRELQDYLGLDPERPQFRQEAEQALVRVSHWLAQRELINADFYRRIGNRYGEVFHLRSLAKDFPESRQGELARRRLLALDAAKDSTIPKR